MKSIVRLTETDMKRIVNRVISEDEHMVAGGDTKACKAVGIKYGKFIGEKDGNGYLMYHIDDNNKQVMADAGGMPRKCTFKRNQVITLG